MISADKATASTDGRLIEQSVRSSLVSLQQLLGGGALDVETRKFIDSTTRARHCLKQLRHNGVEVVLPLSGSLSGAFILVLGEKARRQLVSALLGEAPKTPGSSEMERSALKETGNVIASAFLVALEALCGRGGMPGLPELRLKSTDLSSHEEGPGSVLYGLPVSLVGRRGDGTAAHAGIFIALKHEQGGNNRRH